jgi:hypothetical protein
LKDSNLDFNVVFCGKDKGNLKNINKQPTPGKVKKVRAKKLRVKKVKAKKFVTFKAKKPTLPKVKKLKAIKPKIIGIFYD